MDGMNLRLTLTAIAALSLGACATVDIADMTTMGGDNAQQTAVTSNVVINASNKLYTSFEDKGLCLSSEARMKSAASTLLKGRVADPDTTELTYSDKIASVAAVKADIADSTLLISQAQRAAGVYFELAEPGLDLRPELKSLEQALYATQSARRHFEVALGRFDASETENLNAYENALEQLRLVTNQYGERVRNQSRSSEAGAS